MDFNIRENNQKVIIYDPCRHKYVPLTPEEWVRQHCISFLHLAKKIPLSMLSVEKAFQLNSVVLRYDIVAYSKSAKPLLLVECKAPDVKISHSTFDQIAVYNLRLNVPYLFVSNGIDHFFCSFDLHKKGLAFLKELPDYTIMNTIIEK
jgi:hypothetical protein